MFAAIALAGFVWAITSLHPGRPAVTHDCARRQPTVSPLLSCVANDRRLLLPTTGRIYRPCCRRSPSAVFVALLLLLGGVEINPGPSAATPQTGVALGLLNARSAVHKAALIHDVMADGGLDVLALTETWITSDAPDAVKLDTAPPGFQVVHQSRGSSTEKRGGGLAIVHRNAIAARPLDVGQPSEFEVLATQLTLRPTVHTTVVCLYRPPGAVTQSFCQQFADLLDQLVTAKQRFVICGDFNCPGAGDRQLDVNLDDLLQRYNLAQHVNSATRGDNTLDLLITSVSDSDLLSDVVVQSTCFSDHHLVACRLHVPLHLPTTSRYCYRDVRRVDLAAFHRDVQQSPLYDFDSDTPVDSYVELFNSEVTRTLDKHAPQKSRTRRVGRNDCRWLSAEARDAKRRCRRRERRYRRTKSTTDRLAFQAERKAARDAITRSRSDAIRERFSDVAGNSAATWQAVRDVLHRGHRPVYTDSQCQTLASGFSQYFTDKLERIHESIASCLRQSSEPAFHGRRHTGPTLSQLRPTTAAEVRKVLMSTQLKPSPVDVLPTSLLRSSVDIFAPVFAHIANLSFAQCRFPAAFKTAQVLPLLKKPGMDKDQMSSYRPISNLTTVSKVIERLVLERLRPHLLTSPSYPRLQSAYRCGHSTETALLHLINSVYAAADERKATVLVGLDISAAFDTINHDVLIGRLEQQFGVDGGASSWLRSYLTDRQQFVKLGDHSSAMTQCASGVPQGSVLGPLLFTAYVAPIGDLIEAHGVSYHTFADDTQLLVAMDSSNPAPALDRLANCSAALRLWFLRNDLQLNADKSEVIILGTAPQLRSAAAITSIEVAGSSLQVASKLKSLGVTIDSHLRFDRHVRDVAKACNYHTRALRHVRSLLTDDLAQTVACSIVASRLDYCNAILYGAPAATFDVLQRVQNNLARVVCQSRGRVDARPLLRSLHWLPVRQRVTHKMATTTFKVMSSSTPAYLSDLIKTATPARPLRSSDAPLLAVPRVRTELARRAFSVAAPQTWNSLPANIRQCNSLPTFKRHLKTHLFTHS